MTSLPRWVWFLIVALAAYLVWQWMGTSGAQQYGPIKVMYDRIGQATDSAGNKFASWGGLSHPSR